MPPPQGLVFMVSEVTMRTSKVKRLPIVPSSDGACEPPQPGWHDRPKGAIVAHIFWQQPTTLLLDIRPA